MRISRLASIALFGVSCLLQGQTRVCLGGDLATLSNAQVKACQAKANALSQEARAVGAPAAWHFVMVCDERGWSDYVSFTGNDRMQMMTALQHTDGWARATFVRGSLLETGDTGAMDAVLRAARQQMPAARVRRAAGAARVHALTLSGEQ